MRGRLSAERADDLSRRWQLEGDVVCAVTDGEGAEAGVSSVEDTRVPLVGNRRFWRYRRILAPTVPSEVDDQLLVATFDALDAAHVATDDGPIGVLVVVDPDTGPALGTEAVLPATGFLHAGYAASGRQARIRYFADARIVL